MFEKEAEEYADKYKPNFVVNEHGSTVYTRLDIEQAYIAGAEFGYNKANEWHYVKDELPELYNDVLVIFSQGECDVKHLTNHNEWVGRGSWCSLTDVIAWKEIVPPKEIKEK